MFKNRKGFTLIELLIVVVIIGILAAIAIPKFANTKEKAIIAGMKSDLRNLVTAQEAYFADNNKYTASIGPVQTAADAAFVPTGGNFADITITAPANGPGWSATIKRAGTTRTCAIYANGNPPVAPATEEGAPKCTP